MTFRLLCSPWSTPQFACQSAESSPLGDLWHCILVLWGEACSSSTMVVITLCLHQNLLHHCHLFKRHVYGSLCYIHSSHAVMCGVSCATVRAKGGCMIIRKSAWQLLHNWNVTAATTTNASLGYIQFPIVCILCVEVVEGVLYAWYGLRVERLAFRCSLSSSSSDDYMGLIVERFDHEDLHQLQNYL